MISVVIVNWNTKDLLDRCLTTLSAFEAPFFTQVIVVDNGSSDGSAEMVSRKHPEVTLLAERTNWGYAKGNNLGIACSDQPYVLTLNPDTEFTKPILSEAIAGLEQRSDLGVYAVRLVGQEGKTQSSVRGFPSLIGIFGDVTGLAKALPNSIFDSYRKVGFNYEESQIADQPMGTFLLFKRSALNAVGNDTAPFDENFPIFFNEVDLLYRLQKEGFVCRYDATLSILHHGGESTKQVRKPMIWESHRSLLRYLWKHYSRSPVVLALPLLTLIVYIAAFVRARGYHAGFRP